MQFCCFVHTIAWGDKHDLSLCLLKAGELLQESCEAVVFGDRKEYSVARRIGYEQVYYL